MPKVPAATVQNKVTFSLPPRYRGEDHSTINNIKERFTTIAALSSESCKALLLEVQYMFDVREELRRAKKHLIEETGASIERVDTEGYRSYTFFSNLGQYRAAVFKSKTTKDVPYSWNIRREMGYGMPPLSAKDQELGKLYLQRELEGFYYLMENVHYFQEREFSRIAEGTLTAIQRKFVARGGRDIGHTYLDKLKFRAVGDRFGVWYEANDNGFVIQVGYRGNAPVAQLTQVVPSPEECWISIEQNPSLLGKNNRRVIQRDQTSVRALQYLKKKHGVPDPTY